MACQDAFTLALLTFLTSFSVTDAEIQVMSKKANTEHTRGIAPEGLLLQSPLTHTPGIPPYTVSIFRNIVTTRRSSHDMTLICLPLDKDVDDVTLHDCNLSEGFSRAWATR